MEVLWIAQIGLKYNLNIHLRKYIESDANEIVTWIKNERALKLWSADRYSNYPITAKDINSNYSECIANCNFYPMTLVYKDKVVGHIILRNPDLDKFDIIRLGFIIVDPTIRGKGYGKLLINEAIKYAKTTLNAKEINLGVFENNESAYYCYKSVGFKEIKTEKNVMQFEDEMWNCVEMKLNG